MALVENLEPATRIESILDGEDIEPATRLEYFLKQAAAGGGSGGAFVINRVYGTLGGDPGYLDKSYNEIVAAITNGQAIQVMDIAMQEDYPVYTFYNVCFVSQEGAQSFLVVISDPLTKDVLAYKSETADGQLVFDEGEG
jgi:hypothetical protein